jgi:hypothetical protein
MNCSATRLSSSAGGSAVRDHRQKVQGQSGRDVHLSAAIICGPEDIQP